MTAPREFKLMPVRECPYGDGSPWQDMGQETLGYWKAQIASQPDYDARLEHAVVLFLDAERRLLGHSILDRGGESWVWMDSVSIFPMATAVGAKGLVLAHNHPGGNPTPSDDDRLAARMLAHQGRVAQVELLDFVVIGDGYFCSFAAAGLLPTEEEKVSDKPEPRTTGMALWMLASQVLLPDRALQELIFDASAKAGKRPEELLCEMIREYLDLLLKGDAAGNPKVALAAHSIYGQEAKALTALAIELAADAGEAIWDYLWARGARLLRQDLLALLAKAKESEKILATGVGG